MMSAPNRNLLLDPGEVGAQCVQPHQPRPQPIIQLRGVSKTFKSKGRSLAVFSNFTCDIESRSFLSIVGPSGCGKSTLLKLINGLERPSDGTILFNSSAVVDPPKGMIYVFQQYSKSILPWRTVIENSDCAPEARCRIGKRASALANTSISSGWAATKTITRTSSPAACSSAYASPVR